MPTHPNSAAAYNYIKNSGVLSVRLLEAYWAVCAHGPINQTMAHRKVVEATGRTTTERSIGPRFAVLERMGLIRVSSHKPCPITQRITSWYQSTDENPILSVEDAKPKAASQTLKERIQDLELQVANLQSINRGLVELIELIQTGQSFQHP